MLQRKKIITNQLSLFFALTFLFFLKNECLFAQIGGSSSFTSLALPTNPVTTALGGINVSYNEANPSEVLNNPALLDTSDADHIIINVTPYFAGANFGNLTYSKIISKNIFAAGIQYNSLGTFTQTDVFGNITGTFSVNDLSFFLSHSRRQGNLTFGASLKYASSNFESYQSSALAVDLGAFFKHPTADISAGMVIKNVGIYSHSNVITSSNPILPFDVQLGVSYKPEYMPVRFSIQAHHIHQYNISYLDNSQVKYDLFGNRIVDKISFMDNFFRHFVFGAELLLGKNLQAMLAYNHLKSKDFYTEIGGGLNGISLGFKVKINKIQLSYSYSGIHVAGNINSFGLNCHL